MAFKIILPKLGTNIEEARITAWLKREGERITKGEPLVQVETDKASFELEAEHDGILRKIIFSEGSKAAITRTIAIIAAENEDIALLEKDLKNEEAGSGLSYSQGVWKDWFSGQAENKRPDKSSKIVFSPAAKKMIREKNLDVALLASHFQGKKEAVDLSDLKGLSSLEKVVIYGAGLGAKQSLEIVGQCRDVEVVGLIDDNPKIKNKVIHGHKVLGGGSYLKEAFLRGEFSGVILSFHSEVRKKIFQKIKREIPGIKIKTLIDPRAVISADLELGEGVFIEAGAVIGPGVKIGDAVIVDLGAVVCHDCFIGSYSHLSPGCSISGIVSLKENVLVGVGSSINSTVTVGKDVIITPGSAIMNDIPDGVIVSGIPAVIIGESRRGS